MTNPCCLPRKLSSSNIGGPVRSLESEGHCLELPRNSSKLFIILEPHFYIWTFFKLREYAVLWRAGAAAAASYPQHLELFVPNFTLTNRYNHVILCCSLMTVLCYKITSYVVHVIYLLWYASCASGNLANFHFSHLYPFIPCTIRYDTRCYFNVCSKADMNQLNLPHGTNN